MYLVYLKIMTFCSSDMYKQPYTCSGKSSSPFILTSAGCTHEFTCACNFRPDLKARGAKVLYSLHENYWERIEQLGFQAEFVCVKYVKAITWMYIHKNTKEETNCWKMGCMSEHCSHFNKVSGSATLCTYWPAPICLSIRILSFIWSNSNGIVPMGGVIIM